MYKKILSLTLMLTLLFSAFSVNAEKKVAKPWDEAIVYSLMVDRFNNGDNKNDYDINLKEPLRYHGGDFQGIIDKLDYIQEMGFNTIQLSSIFDNEENGYHGEWIIDYFKPEEHFGTIEKFKELVQDISDRGMKILVEFPVNQLGKSHPWVTDEQAWIQTNTEGFPTPDLSMPEVQQYFIDVANWWVIETGLDGFVMTDVNEGPIEFWQEFSASVKAENPSIFLMGTTSDASQDQTAISEYLNAGIDSMGDVPLNRPLREAFSKPDRSLQPVIDVWEQNEATYEKPALMTAFFDHANMERYTRDMVNENEFPGIRWKLALTYLFAQPEIPVVYYASEIAVDGGQAPENRQTMNFRTDPELIDHITTVGEVRRNQPALTKGTWELLYENNGMAIIKRQYKEDTVVLAINNTTKDSSALISADQLEDNKELRGLLGTDLVRSDNGKYKIVVERESAEIYKMTEKSGINILFIFALIAVFGLFVLFMYIVWKRGKNRPIK